jgi:DNA-binding NarL/FixJ family response regulator
MTAPTFIGVQKNCPQCGEDYLAESGYQRKCPACRKLAMERSRVERGNELGKPLSPRQSQVVDRLVQGKLNKEIGYELHLTEGTVKQYVNHILLRLGFHNRTEIAVWAVKRAA